LFIIRSKIASQEVYLLTSDLSIEAMTVQELLDMRDRLVNRYYPNEGDLLEIDFGPFYDYSPIIRDPKNIGKGVQFLNRYLSSKLFADPKQWQESLFNFLRLHQYRGIQLLINGRIQSQQHLSEKIKAAIAFISNLPEDERLETFRLDLQTMGFEPGWGNTASRVLETLNILDELIDSPAPQTLETFISRIPMIFNIVLVSPHGWFGQEGVLGRPDTGMKFQNAVLKEFTLLTPGKFIPLNFYLLHVHTVSGILYPKKTVKTCYVILRHCFTSSINLAHSNC
jgi:sucrose synthase